MAPEHSKQTSHSYEIPGHPMGNPIDLIERFASEPILSNHIISHGDVVSEYVSLKIKGSICLDKGEITNEEFQALKKDFLDEKTRQGVLSSQDAYRFTNEHGILTFLDWTGFSPDSQLSYLMQEKPHFEKALEKGHFPRYDVWLAKERAPEHHFGWIVGFFPSVTIPGEVNNADMYEIVSAVDEAVQSEHDKDRLAALLGED